MKIIKFIAIIFFALTALSMLWDVQLDAIPKIHTYFMFWVIVISFNTLIHLGLIYWIIEGYFLVFKEND